MYQRFGEAEAALTRFFEKNIASPAGAPQPRPSSDVRAPSVSQTGRFGNSPGLRGSSSQAAGSTGDLRGAGSSAGTKPILSAAPGLWGNAAATPSPFTPLVGAPKRQAIFSEAPGATCTPPPGGGGMRGTQGAAGASSQDSPMGRSMSQAPAPEPRGGFCALSQLSELRGSAGARRGEGYPQNCALDMRPAPGSFEGTAVGSRGSDGAPEHGEEGSSRGSAGGYTRSTPSLSAVLASLTDESPVGGREAEGRAPAAAGPAGGRATADGHGGRGAGATSGGPRGARGVVRRPGGGPVAPEDGSRFSERGRKRPGSPTLASSVGPTAEDGTRAARGDGTAVAGAGTPAVGRPPGGGKPRGSGVRPEVSQYLAEVSPCNLCRVLSASAASFT